MGGPPNSDKKISSTKKAAATGGAVLLEMVTGGLAMENIKMEKQRTNLPYSTLIGRVGRQGLAGFEAGLWPWGVVLGLTKGTVLGGALGTSQNLLRSAGCSDRTTKVASGFMAGAVQGVFMSPILLARTRVNQSLTERAASSEFRASLMDEMRHSSRILSNAVRTEGLRVLTTGMGMMAVKRSMDWGARFVLVGAVQDKAKQLKGGEPLNELERLATAYCGGVASVMVTMPADRLMPIIQAAKSSGGASGSGGGIMGIMRERLREEGFTTMFRGGMMRAMHTGWHTSFALVVSDKIMALMGE